MANLREDVRIITLDGELAGHLFVGADGLPELKVQFPGECRHHETESVSTFHVHHFRPATFPAAWRLLMGSDSFRIGPLFHAWRDIEDVRRSIIDAQREAERGTLHG